MEEICLGLLGKEPAALILRPTCLSGDVPGGCRGGGTWCNGSVLYLVALFSALESISIGLMVKMASPHSNLWSTESLALIDT